MKKLDFKPTKWNIKYCPVCRDFENKTWYGVCGKKGHVIESIPNVPFFMPELIIKRLTYKGWAFMDDPTGRFCRGFELSPSNLERIILERGVEPGGKLNDSWWMWAKVGSRYSLKWVKEIDDSNEQK